MARMNPGIWDKVQKNVQEAERLAEQNKYDLSIIKTRQTLEYIVKLQCDQAGIVEGPPETMVRELYKNQWIQKPTAERFLKILAIANDAANSGTATAANAQYALDLLSQEVAGSGNGAPSRGQRPRSSQREEMSPRTESRQGARPARDGRESRDARSQSAAARQSSRNSRSSGQRRTSSSSSRSRKKGGRSGLIPADLLKLLIPLILIVILIFLVRMLTPDKTPTAETTTPAPSTETITTEAPTTTPPETEPETEPPVVYKTTDTLNVRKEPSTDASKLGKLSPGTVIDFVGDYDDTWAIIMYNEQQAYVSKEYLTEATP